MEEKHITPKTAFALCIGEKSKGKSLPFSGRKLHCSDSPKRDVLKGWIYGVSFLQGGRSVREWAPQAVREGAKVIDNSSAFRMRPEAVPLVVPEVNAHHLQDQPLIS